MKGKKLTKDHNTPGSKQIQVNDGGQRRADWLQKAAKNKN